MMKPPVCLPLEIQNRDLDGRLYFAAKCVEAGYPALIGIRARIHRFFRKDLEGPVYYMSKGNKPSVPMQEKIKRMGGFVFLQDEEGGGELFFDGEVGAGFIPTQHLVDKVFVWGELQRKYTEKLGADPAKLLVTGNPRFDLYKPERSDFYKKISKRLPIPDKFILIASNQEAANPLLSHEQEKGHLRFIFGDDFDEQAYDERAEREKYRLNRLIALARRLAATYPDHHIVFRPHPAEEMSFYDNLFAEKNILVTNEGCSLEWIVNCDAFIHVDCTTGIEAFLVGKEVISYLPPDHREGLTEAPLEVSRILGSEDDVVEVVGKALAQDGRSTLPPEEKRRKEEKLSQLFANITMESAPAMIATFAEFPWEGTPQRLKPKSLIYRLAKKLRKIWKGDRLNELDLRARKKFPGLSMNEVRRKIELFREVEPTLPPIRIREYDIDTFLLEPK
ncbi:surface carbohydrate biosynthesis protein [Salidesulfovibrio onnuriiensis]|uniref:surface carbohydrate biosynthesis protein n=1 Tax=Salidesulfovibrio onnuriiensis TaxID=2583823 RepID=UPI0011CAF358|nr:surface carbohydrate biosynthesis protein [Salidesulfovibrio onnuriiensis]